MLELTDGARAWLGRVGYDPVYGARPLKRAVQKYLQDPLADAILRGEIRDGQTVKVDEGDGALKLDVNGTAANRDCPIYRGARHVEGDAEPLAGGERHRAVPHGRGEQHQPPRLRLDQPRSAAGRGRARRCGSPS